jgi:hypothetical protein
MHEFLIMSVGACRIVGRMRRAWCSRYVAAAWLLVESALRLGTATP